jgi:membrane fusion protein (multidrug efflux system)
MAQQPQEAPKVTLSVPVEAAPEAKKRNPRFAIVLGLLVVAGAAFGINKYVHGQHHEETDDAQLEANISPAIPRVSGYISSIRVSDNQRVRRGDTLLVLDDRDARIRLQQAEAALAAARSSLSVAQATTSASRAAVATSRASVGTADAQVDAAKVRVWRATQDYNRYANLVKDHSITQQQYEQALAEKQTSERQLQVLVEQRAAAASQTTTAGAQSMATGEQVGVANATIQQRQADVEAAKLTLSYTAIVAPADGYVSRVGIQNGQFIQAGQALFNIVTDDALWVVANFKETQLSKMHVGQKVTVKVDAFPNRHFEARLTSFSPATGARFSLLPPDNATGNFVKVVQRVPVKIEFVNPSDKDLKKLRAGLNVSVDVHLD